MGCSEEWGGARRRRVNCGWERAMGTTDEAEEGEGGEEGSLEVSQEKQEPHR